MDDGLSAAMRLEGRDEYTYVLRRIGVELERQQRPTLLQRMEQEAPCRKALGAG